MLNQRKIEQLAKKYDIDELSVISVLYRAIATIYNANGATIIDGEIYLTRINLEKRIFENTKITPKPRAVRNVLKEFIKRLQEYSLTYNFTLFFNYDRFYKVKGKVFKNDRIYLDVIDNNKSNLYKFYIEVSELSLKQIKNIREKSFFADDNVFYVNILEFDRHKSEIKCGILNPKFLKMFIRSVLKIVFKRGKKHYKVQNIAVDIDKYTKEVRYFLTFSKKRRPSYKLIGIIERILSKELGRVKVFIK